MCHPKIYRSDTIGSIRGSLSGTNLLADRHRAFGSIPVTKRAGRRAVHAVLKSRLPFLNA